MEDLSRQPTEIKSKKKLLDLDPLSLIDIGTLNMPLRPYACLKRSNINGRNCLKFNETVGGR